MKRIIRGSFMLFLFVFLALLPCTVKADETLSLTLKEGVYQYDKAFQVVELVNKEREAKGLNPLTMDRNLLEAAMLRAAEVNVFVSHTRPNGTSCLSACPLKMYAENIAGGSTVTTGTAEEVMDSWMNSAGHRSNILDSSLTSIGVGCFSQGSMTYWVQTFGRLEAVKVSQPANQAVRPVIEILPGLVSLYFGGETPIGIQAGSTVTLDVRNVNAGWKYGYASIDPSCLTFTSSDSNAVTVNQSGTLSMNQGGVSTISAALRANPLMKATAEAKAYYRFEDASVPVIPDMDYTGSAITPSPTVTYNGKTLRLGTDYQIEYQNNLQEGRYAAAIFTGCGVYQGTITRTFAIKRYSLRDKYEVKFSAIPDAVYTGNPIRPVPKISYNGVELIQGVDYTVTYEDNVEVGTGVVTCTGIGKYKDSRERYFYIRGIPLREAVIGAVPDVQYNGSAFTPEPSVVLNGKALRKGIDYTYEYHNNITASNRAEVDIIGIGNYDGLIVKYFKILPVTVSGEKISFQPTESLGNQNVREYIKKYLNIQYQGKTLTDDHYMVTQCLYGAGELLYFQISYSGNYQGSRTFQSLKRCTVSAIGDQTYTGSAITPAVTVKCGSDTLKAGTDYTVSYSKNNAVGTAAVKITGKGVYFDSVTVSFKIRPKEHVWDNGKVTVQPTCTKTGTKVYTCKECGETKKETVKAAGHKWNSKYTVDQKATCTSKGSQSIHCGVCDAKKEGSVQEISAVGHTWDKGKVTVQPTCTKAGTKVYTCTACKETRKETVKAVGHKWNSKYTVDKEATCTTKGSKSIHCSVCKQKKAGSTKTIAAKGHKWSSWKTTKAATYTQSGKKQRTCSTCKKKETKTIAKKTLKTVATPTVKAASGKKIKVTWKKVPDATGYVVYCKAGKNGKYQKVATTKKLSITHTKRKAGVTYYYKVRAYKTVSSKPVKNVYGAFSKVKSVKAK